jgi:KaiC/GvpD/RAD55 family RecA-like ATPase
MVGVCYSCGSAYPKAGRKYDQEILDKYPLEDKGFNSPVVVVEKPADSLYKFVPMRGITQDVMEFYNVRTLCTREGVPVQQEYIYPSGSKKTRRLPKSFTAVGKMDELFGMNLFVAGTSKMVTITEGELDAMSAWQMVGRGSRYPTPVVSLPSANPSKAFWENVIPWLDSFEKIVLSVDKDGAGDEVAQKINNIFPNKVYRVDHTLYKDANEFLQANKASEYKGAWYNAQRFMPDNILHSADDLLELFDETPDHSYVPTGIPEFDKKAMGLMQGHFTVFKAPTGIGKTELMRYLEWNFLQRGITFATMHLEETKLRSVLGLVSYDLKDNLTRKDLVEEKGKTDEVRASIKRLGDSENYYQYFIKDGQGADELISQIRMFKEAYDCDYVLFEPVQDVISVGSEQNKEGLLAELAVRLSKVAADLNVGIITIAHTNEDNEIKYCKMLGQRASVIVRLDRDKEAEDFMDRNTTRLIIEKNRPTSEEGHAGDMLFDTSTFTMEAL